MLYKETQLPVGSIFNGNTVVVADVFMIADDNITRKRSLLSELNTPALQNAFLEVVKNIHIGQSIQSDFNKDLSTAFEYPVSSGNLFSITQDKTSSYNELFLHSASFAYPLVYKGNGASSVTFSDATDVNAFVAASLSTQQACYNDKFIVATNNVRAVAIATTLEQAILDVFNVAY